MSSSKFDPEAVVQRQLDAYNRLDLEAFVREFSADVLAYRMQSHEPFLSGKAALTEYYRDHRFNQPKLHSQLVNRMVFGNKVIDHELITGVGDEAIELAAVYEVTGAEISRVWFISGK